MLELPQRPVLCTGPQGLCWLDKTLSENLPSFRQIIPYLVVQCGDRIMAYRRKAGDPRLQGEASIGIGGHVEYSDYLAAIGLVKYDPFPTARSSDVPFHYVVAYAAYREFTEECFMLGFGTTNTPDLTPEPYAFWVFCNELFGDSTKHTFNCHDFIDLDDNEVSKAHHGIVAHIHIPASMTDAIVHTAEHEHLGWFTVDELWEMSLEASDRNPDKSMKFELWSQHVIDLMFAEAHPVPAEPDSTTDPLPLDSSDPAFYRSLEDVESCKDDSPPSTPNNDTTDFPTKPCRNCGAIDRPQYKGTCNDGHCDHYDDPRGDGDIEEYIEPL